MKYIAICLLFAGCAMTPDEMASLKSQCAKYGMGVRWGTDPMSGMITHGQCEPFPAKGQPK